MQIFSHTRSIPCPIAINASFRHLKRGRAPKIPWGATVIERPSLDQFNQCLLSFLFNRLSISQDANLRFSAFLELILALNLEFLDRPSLFPVPRRHCGQNNRSRYPKTEITWTYFSLLAWNYFAWQPCFLLRQFFTFYTNEILSPFFPSLRMPTFRADYRNLPELRLKTKKKVDKTGERTETQNDRIRHLFPFDFVEASIVECKGLKQQRDTK